ncbi:MULTISPECIES: histidine kinase [unclassified Lentimicrobium]|uniref:histidine kinase n=1 Tax=unclassified Lentimicrobium TaxID=2677434 RepID=UPI00155441FD|nr:MULTISPECIES: histidine kinase [unclassified Lentimicrobium]NPD45977.1 histidine kinase [Lentimicrobium sp. S6]NPD84256.1 histidine kinase [Lentimicrobium sp. L6]
MKRIILRNYNRYLGKSILWFALCFLFPYPSFSQFIDIHSFELDEEKQELLDKADSLAQNDFNLSLSLCLDEINKLKFYDKPGMYSSLLSRAGRAAFHIGNLSLSDSIHDVLINIPIKNLHPFVKAEILKDKYFISKVYNENLAALEYAKQAYLIYQQSGFIDGQLELLHKALVISTDNGDLEKATNYETDILSLIDDCGKPKTQFYLWLSISRLNIKTHNFGKALIYLTKAKDLAKTINDNGVNAHVLVAQGLFYFHQKNLNKANELFNEAIINLRQTHDRISESHVTTLQAAVSMRQEHYKDALGYNRRALNLRKRLGSLYLVASSYTNMANTLIQMQQYDSALYYTELGAVNYINYPIKRNITRGLEVKQEIFLKRNEFDKAYQALEAIIEIEDSIYLMLNKQKLDQLETNIELEKYMQQKKEIRAETLLQKSLKDRNMIIIKFILASLILVVISSYLLFLYNKSKSRRRLIGISQKMIFIQMNSHFVFNALTAIQSLIYQNQIETAIHYLTVFSSLITKVLTITHKKYITLQAEISFVMEFMQIQQLRFGDDMKFIIDINPDLDLVKEKVPPMLIYPFLEYAAEECVQQSDEDNRIEINIYKENSFIIYEIIDIGLGFSDEGKCYIKRYGGQEIICEQLTKERISLYNNIFHTKLIFVRSKVERDGQEYNAIQFKIKS